MSVDAPRQSLPPLSQLKPAPTQPRSSPSSPGSILLQTPDQLYARKRSQKTQELAAANDKATINFIRRVLCPQTATYGSSTPQPLDELLPPLTSSNDVDFQLYALIAIIIKEFIYSWYSKITPDQAFVNELLQVIAHCTRALEQRLRNTDVAQLIFDDIPALIETHILSCRRAQSPSSLTGLSSSPRSIYHALNPHPALSPVPDPLDQQSVEQQLKNEAAYRQLLAHGALTVLLPTEELENVCLRTIVGDVLADSILGKEVSKRACEGRFLWEATANLLGTIVRQDGGKSDDPYNEQGRGDRLERIGLLSSTDETQSMGSAKPSRFSMLIWNILQMIYMTYVAMRFIGTGLYKAASADSATGPQTPGVSRIFAHSISKPRKAPSQLDRVSAKRAVLEYRLHGMLSRLVDLPNRMPWLAGLLALFQYLLLRGPGTLGDAGSILDRFLRQTINTYLLTPALLCELLRAARTTLFSPHTRPNLTAGLTPASAANPHSTTPPSTLMVVPGQIGNENSKGGVEEAVLASASISSSTEVLPEQPPSMSETAAVKRECAIKILALVPRPVARKLLGISLSDAFLQPHADAGDEKQQHEEEPVQSPSPSPSREPMQEDLEGSLLLEALENDVLDIFADEYCNKHLVYAIIEKVLARLLPELTERSVCELLEDRGITLLSDE